MGERHEASIIIECCQLALTVQVNCVLKGCFTVQKIVIEIRIEIGMEQTRIFQCNRFHYAENQQSPSRFFSGSDLD